MNNQNMNKIESNSRYKHNKKNQNINKTDKSFVYIAKTK